MMKKLRMRRRKEVDYKHNEFTKQPFPTEVVINIANHLTIKNIQTEFNIVFPYLKIEFFLKIRQKHELLLASEVISPENDLKFFLKNNFHEIISLDSQKTVHQVENEFEEQLDLHARIFRSTGGIWIATVLTGNWTLQKQNDEGRELSRIICEQSFD